jgi:hypothetical protein
VQCSVEIEHLGIPREQKIGSAQNLLNPPRRNLENRGVSFCDSLSSSLSSCKSSNGSSIAEDDNSSLDAGCISQEDDDDKCSSGNESDSDDLEDKIKWFFLRADNEATLS